MPRTQLQTRVRIPNDGIFSRAVNMNPTTFIEVFAEITEGPKNLIGRSVTVVMCLESMQCVLDNYKDNNTAASYER